VLDTRIFGGHSETRRRYATVLMTALVIATLSPLRDAASQDSSPATRSGWALGGSVGMPGDQRSPYYPLVTIGLNATQLRANYPGVDLAIGTAPYPLAFGIANAAGRIGVAVPIAVGRAWLVPSAGVSAVGVASLDGNGGTAIYGVNAGAAAILPASASTGLRLGMTVHRFAGSREALWLMEIGFVHLPAATSSND
jgi:hypothetical protein